MDYRMDSGWQLHPLGGETGQAYMGVRDGEYVFLKRNATPFLAAVSMEGIAPKLLWTKRTANGDELSAQEWVQARELTNLEMSRLDVLQLVRDVHQSELLLNMLHKISGVRFGTADFLALYTTDLQKDLRTHTYLNTVLRYLQDTAHLIEDTFKTVCHGDLDRRNFLVTEDNRLYLVDWEMVRFADPLSDIAMILTQYVLPQDWESCLQAYGIMIDEHVWQRIEWYALWHAMMVIKKSHFQGNHRQANENILLIKHIFATKNSHRQNYL